MEVWKEAVGFDGKYLVSNLGNVYSRITNKMLKQSPQNHGYMGVWLYGNGGVAGRNGRLYAVHRLVADAFCERKPHDTEVNHKNEIKWDNRAENLEWCTHKENSNYGTRGARIGQKNVNGKRSKTTYQYTLDGELVNEYPSVHEAARANGFLIGNICKCIKDSSKSAYGYRWSH